MSKYIHHVTLNTGHVRNSPRTEVADEIYNIVQPLLSAAIAGERPTIPAVEPACTLTAAAQDRCLIATVWGPDMDGRRVPIVTIGVASHSRCGAQLWPLLHERVSVPVVSSPTEVPPEPWCAVRIDIGFGFYPAAAQWLGDFERCLAWAWVDSQ